MKQPAHLVELVNARTGQDIDQPAGRNRTTTARCPRCHAPTLTGLDDEVAALAATADPTPLDRTGEARALFTGRATYTLTRSGPATVLRHRDHWTITGQPADPTGAPVLPAHACGQPLAAHRALPGRPTKETPDACPY